MKRELYFEAATMGDFCFTAGRPARARKVKPLPDCSWFRSCEQCRWGDCMAGNAEAAYDSAAGRMKRGEAFAGMMLNGKTAGELAEFFGMTEEQVKEEAESRKTIVASGRKRGKADTMLLRAEAVRRRTGGEAEMSVAVAVGVSTRQVRRWCKGVKGIKRGDGNRHRKAKA